MNTNLIPVRNKSYISTRFYVSITFFRFTLMKRIFFKCLLLQNSKFGTFNSTSTSAEQSVFFNRDLNRGCLVYVFSLRFSGSKFWINLRRQFRVRKIFSCTYNFSNTRFCRICSLFILCLKLLFRICVNYVLLFYQNLLMNKLLTTVFVLVNGIVFSRSNGLITQCLIAYLMN